MLASTRGLRLIHIPAPALRSCMLKSTYPILAPSAKRWASSSSGVTPTTKMTPQENIALLNAQRLHRPNSPHLSIYQPQVSPCDSTYGFKEVC